MSLKGQSRRLSDVGMSASPPTTDVWLRRSELTLRASSGQLWARPFDRPETLHPIKDDAKREAHVAHLNVVLGLLRSRE